MEMTDKVDECICLDYRIPTTDNLKITTDYLCELKMIWFKIIYGLCFLFIYRNLYLQ
jgi:hypothetical protein